MPEAVDVDRLLVLVLLVGIAATAGAAAAAARAAAAVLVGLVRLERGVDVVLVALGRLARPDPTVPFRPAFPGPLPAGPASRRVLVALEFTLALTLLAPVRLVRGRDFTP